MEKSNIENSFEGGVWSDFDPQKLSGKVMTSALNGRVVFNKNGTLSFNNGNGNKLAISIGFNYGASSNYKIIGSSEISGYLILFSTQNTVSVGGLFSEIGLLTEAQKGVYAYQTIFNDQYDPNGQKLRLSSRYQIKSYAVLETKDIVRAYWIDDNNENRTFNVRAGALPYKDPRNGITYFTTPYAQNPPHTYPYWYSVHGMSAMADIQFGLLKYNSNISGKLTVGTRQYFYRLRHLSGYATPWSPGSGMVMLTTGIPTDIDWTQYFMNGSGVPTNKGQLVDIKYIDQRFSSIEVAAALYQTDGLPIGATIFYQGPITGTTMQVAHTNDIGLVPIPDPTTLVQRYVDILHSKTDLVNENYYHLANVVLRGNLEIDTSLITIRPFLRKMLSDEEADVQTTPLTNQGVYGNGSYVGAHVDYNLFSGFTESYPIGSPLSPDYANYKGTQWDCLFKGEFRGQTVPYAIVLFNRKGQPFFAQHIGDFSFPEQYNNNWINVTLDASGNVVTTTGTQGVVGDYTLTDYTPGSTDQIFAGFIQNDFIVPKILGKMISGIDLTDVLYDAFGDLQLSGFSIVRADRIPNLVAQGLVMNCSDNTNINNTMPIIGAKGTFLGPLRSTGNKYYNPPPPGFNSNIDHGNSDDGSAGGYRANFIAPNYFTLELPDYMVNPNLLDNNVQPGILDNDSTSLKIKLVGATQAAFITGDPAPYGVGGSFSKPTQLGNNGNFYTDFYSKNYFTYMNQLNYSDQSGGVITNSNGNVGAEYDIQKLFTGIFDTVQDIDDCQFYNVSFLNNFYFGIGDVPEGIYHAHGHPGTVVMKSSTYNNASLTRTVGAPPNLFLENRICYYLVNLVTDGAQTLNPSVLAGRTYKDIGHFIPINAATIAAATSGGRVVFNDCEVWGGDCYVDYFGYSRLMPLYDAVAPHLSSFFDYGVGLIFPCETLYNHTMRSGVTFPSVAMRPGIDEEPNPTGPPVFQSGIYMNHADATDQRIEDFNVNSALQATDMISAYFPKGVYFVDEPDQPLLELASNIKIPGETYDQFRLFLVNNNQPADSQYGFVTDLQALGMNIYVLQEKGFGRIRFNERTLETTSAANLTVGTGQGYQGHDYIGGKDYGCQHEWSVVNNKKAIYWVNAYQGKHNRFAGNGLECLSDTYGQHSYFEDNAEVFWQIPNSILSDGNENIYDNPCDVGGISSVYDYTNKADIVTFTQHKIMFGPPAPAPQTIITVGTPSTMEFGDASSHYEGNWNFYKPIYFSFKQNFLSYDPLNVQNMYQHNVGRKGEFDGIIYDSQLEFVANVGTEAYYDNMEINMNPSGFASLKNIIGTTENGGQQVNFNDITDDRPVFRNGMAVFPMMSNNQPIRVVGKYLDALITIDNTTNQDVLISAVKSYIRKDFR